MTPLTCPRCNVPLEREGAILECPVCERYDARSVDQILRAMKAPQLFEEKETWQA